MGCESDLGKLGFLRWRCECIGSFSNDNLYDVKIVNDFSYDYNEININSYYYISYTHKYSRCRHCWTGMLTFTFPCFSPFSYSPR